jgi:pyruvate/2-oxoglutarate dehydrogenase complex dihydrolipoamide dehydrogenase (E3) component
MFVEFAIIGGGQAGNPLAHALSQAGHSTVLIEGKHLGGSCVNYGCTPTKAVIVSARLAYQARRAQDFGLEIPEVKVNFAQVLAQAREIVKESRDGLAEKYDNAPNLKLIRGYAKLDGRDSNGNIQIRVAGGETIAAAKVILNMGTHTSIPDISGLDRSRILDAENWLYHDELPKSLIMLGSGYIGVEMAQFYRRMGVDVTLIDRGEQILGREDRDVAEELEKLLEKEGIRFHKKSSPEKIERNGDGWKVSFNGKDLTAKDIFVATGRKPSLEGAGLDSLGIEIDKKGYVKCDSRLATSAPGVWVAGDIRGGFQFTHTSWDDFRILESFFLGDGLRTLDRIVPYAIFTDPELGRVGLSEKDALEKYSSVRVGRFNFADNGKANETRETEGFIKLIAHPEKDELLGATVLGPHGSEVVQLYVTLMNAKAPFSVIRDAIYIHPTLAEAAQSAVYELFSAKKTEKKAA